MSFPLFFDFFPLPFFRIFTFFFLSPLFAGGKVPFLLKLAPTLVLTLVLTIANTSSPTLSYEFLLKEIIWGYFLGVFLRIFLEAFLLGGELLGNFLGLSFNEVVGVSSPSPLLGRFWLLLGVTLLISMDLHHLLIKLFSQPLANFSSLSFSNFLAYSGHFFPLAFQLVFFPFFIYALFLMLLSLASKMVPEIPLFFLSPPLQLLMGIGAIFLSLSHFPSFIYHSFHKILDNFWMAFSSSL